MSTLDRFPIPVLLSLPPWPLFTIQGSRRDSGGQRVHLDLRELQSFALFPGQAVAVQGINGSGGRMVARGIIEGVPRPLCASAPAELSRLQYGADMAGGRPLSIFAAAGPFTTSDSLVYEPLNDLLGAVRAARPDVVVLMGPFVDAEHPKVIQAGSDWFLPGQHRRTFRVLIESADCISLCRSRLDELLSRSCIHDQFFSCLRPVCAF